MACKKEELILPTSSVTEVFRTHLIGRWADVDYWENSYQLSPHYEAVDTLVFTEEGRFYSVYSSATHFYITVPDTVELYALDGLDTIVQSQLYIATSPSRENIYVHFRDSVLSPYRWPYRFYSKIE